MSFVVKASSSGSEGYEIAPDGNHPAVLVALVDLGTQRTEYNKEVKWQRQVYLVWELTTEKMAGMKDRNHLIARAFTFSFNEKAMLRGFLEKWSGSSFRDGEEFDLAKMLGTPCLLTVIHKQSGSGKTYAKVDGVGKVIKGLKVPEAQNEPVAVEFGEEVPGWIPFLYGESVKDVIGRSKETEEREAEAAGKSGSIPF